MFNFLECLQQIINQPMIANFDHALRHIESKSAAESGRADYSIFDIHAK
jgi:hypothetical protein